MEFDLDNYPSNILKDLICERDWRGSVQYNLYNHFICINSMIFDFLILDFHKEIFKVIVVVNLNISYTC